MNKIQGHLYWNDFSRTVILSKKISIQDLTRNNDDRFLFSQLNTEVIIIFNALQNGQIKFHLQAKANENWNWATFTYVLLQKSLTTNKWKQQLDCPNKNLQNKTLLVAELGSSLSIECFVILLLFLCKQFWKVSAPFL